MLENAIKMNKLKISVVTVCFNAVDVIEKTILSIVNQTYQNIEYIIIDGASTDGTVDIIKKYRNNIAYFISEPDKGIYDAMNKGIKIATGEWINFMNAGDGFHNEYVITNFIQAADTKFDIIYGSIIKVLPDIHYRCDPFPIAMMEKCMPILHQGTFIKTAYHKQHLFDTSFKSSGDYHFFYNAYYKYGAKFKEIDLVISDFDESDGMSKVNIKIARLEDLRIWKKEDYCPAVLYIWLRIIYWRIMKFIDSILPETLSVRWRNYKLEKQGYNLVSNKTKAKDSLRILELTGEPIASGGQEMFIVNVLRHMDMTRLHIDLLTPYYCDNESYREDVEKLGGNVVCFNLSFAPGGLRLNILRPIHRYLRHHRYDIIHIHSGSTIVLAMVALIARINKIPSIIVHSHSTGFVKNTKYYFLKACTYPLLKKIPDVYCACSKEAGLWKFPTSVCTHQLKVIKNGIDLTLFAPNLQIRYGVRKRFSISDELLLGQVGRLSFQKNQEFSIKILSILKRRGIKSRLMLVGDGELLDTLKTLAVTENVCDDVFFVGRVADVYNYVQAMDLFLFPSRWEGFGLVGVEAQGVGVPIIASTAVPQEMKLTDDVFYLPLDSVEEWVDKIIEVSSLSRKNNIAKIREQGYDINQTAEELRKLYLNS